MDWLVDPARTGDSDGLAEVSSQLEQHHTGDQASLATVRRALSEQVGPLAGDVTEPGDLLHLSLDWTRRVPVLTCASVTPPADDPEPVADGVVPARHRARVRAWPRRELALVEVPVVRRSVATYAGPLPVEARGLDLDRQGPSAVTVALAAAVKSHPTASVAQAAAIAGCFLAEAGAVDRVPTDTREVAEAFLRLSGVIGGKAYVVRTDADVLELAVASSPLAGRGVDSLCHVASGLAGQLAAHVAGAVTVAVDDAVVSGETEWHLQVRLAPAGALDGDGDGAEGHAHGRPVWALTRTQPTPHFDLSVTLPREGGSVPIVRRLAAQALRAFGVADDDVSDVQLAITEACANVIVHAEAADTYDVTLEMTADRCSITVVDQGRGFDPSKVPDRAPVDAESGRGLILMRALVDNVAFRNEPQAGAIVHMVKTLSYDDDHPLRHG